MNEEGVIKYNGNWVKAGVVEGDWFNQLDAVRSRLYQQKLVGKNQDGIGYGNISIRHHQNQFIISGTGTGCIENLEPSDYTLVTEFDFEQNSLTATGPVMASSESLTHAMIYQTRAEANAVIHVHHYELWKKLLATHPSTSELVPYGTPGMANEVKRLLLSHPHLLVFAMGGHEEGVIAFGKNPAAALNSLMTVL